ncbi:MAG: hypothetical protein AB7R89_11555 [Dehalococcoidia bacterium]
MTTNDTITCPTCQQALPNFAVEKAYEAALGEHSKLVEALAGRITSDEWSELEQAAGDVHWVTLHAIRARLLRLRPDLADLIELATGDLNHRWQEWVQYGERR